MILSDLLTLLARLPLMIDQTHDFGSFCMAAASWWCTCHGGGATSLLHGGQEKKKKERKQKEKETRVPSSFSVEIHGSSTLSY